MNYAASRFDQADSLEIFQLGFDFLTNRDERPLMYRRPPPEDLKAILDYSTIDAVLFLTLRLMRANLE